MTTNACSDGGSHAITVMWYLVVLQPVQSHTVLHVRWLGRTLQRRLVNRGGSLSDHSDSAHFPHCNNVNGNGQYA